MATGVRHRVLQVAAAAIVIAFMKWAAAVLVPLLLASLIAVVVAPIVRLRVLPLWARVPLALVTPVGATVGCGWLIVSSATELVESLPQYQTRTMQLRDELVSWLHAHRLWPLADVVHHFDGEDAVRHFIEDSLLEFVHVAAIASFSAVVAFFILGEARVLPRKLAVMGPAARVQFRLVRAKLREIERYLLVKTWICIGTGTSAGALTYMLGVPHWELWALLTFLLTYVPFIGPLIAAGPAIATALLARGLGTALLVAVGFLTIKLVFGYILEPKLTGDSMGLSPLVALLSILFWGWVLGSVGALVSVPLTMIARMLLARAPDWRWLAMLLGSANDDDVASAPEPIEGVPAPG